MLFWLLILFLFTTTVTTVVVTTRFKKPVKKSSPGPAPEVIDTSVEKSFVTNDNYIYNKNGGNTLQADIDSDEPIRFEKIQGKETYKMTIDGYDIGYVKTSRDKVVISERYKYDYEFYPLEFIVIITGGYYVFVTEDDMYLYYDRLSGKYYMVDDKDIKSKYEFENTQFIIDNRPK